MRMKPNRHNRGFTLIELMIVVATLGILSAIAIPKMGSAITKAKAARTVATVKAIEAAIRHFNQDTGTWPRQLAYSWNPNDLLTAPPNTPGWTGPYIGRWHSTAWGGSIDLIRNLDCNGNGITEFLIYMNEDSSIINNDNAARIPMEGMMFIDKSMDNGDLSTGRIYGNGTCSSAIGEVVFVMQWDVGP
jgi:type II secretion system protein G